MGAVPGSTTLFALGSGTYGSHLTSRRQRISPATTHGGPVTHLALASSGRPELDAKADLRKRLRAERRAAVAALDPRTRALLMMRPPAALAARVPAGATIGLYRASPDEAPTLGYAKWFHEAGHPLALPAFTTREAPMHFRAWANPYDDEGFEPGPWTWRIAQPHAAAAAVIPHVVFVPLVGFSAAGGRLGQGGGHYDRWLAGHPQALAIGLAWDAQLVEDLPTEAHDRMLDAVVTPTRLYGPFERARVTAR